jgi:hypothetical protein
MAFVAVLLDMLPMPSIDGVGEVYQWLKNRRSAPGGELLTTSGQGLYFNPRSILGWGARGCPMGSGGGNGFLTGEDLNLKPVAQTRRSVGTLGTPMASPRG